MKRSYALIIFILTAACAFAQQPVDLPAQQDNPIHKSEKVKAYEAQFFCCPQCDFLSKGKGVCPNHQVTLLKPGTYYCATGYHYSSGKKGICPEHKTALKQVEVKYRRPNP